MGILVTGGAGYIAAHALIELIKQKFDVVVGSLVTYYSNGINSALNAAPLKKAS